MSLVIKPIGMIRAPRPTRRSRPEIKKRGHVYIDGPVQMRKGEMSDWLSMESRLSKVLTHLMAKEVAPRREWYRNIFVREHPEGPTEAEVMDAIQKAAAEIAMQVIPPEDLPRA